MELTFQNLSQAIATDVKAKLHAKVATKDPNPLDSKGRPLPKSVAQKCSVSWRTMTHLDPQSELIPVITVINNNSFTKVKFCVLFASGLVFYLAWTDAYRAVVVWICVCTHKCVDLFLCNRHGLRLVHYCSARTELCFPRHRHGLKRNKTAKPAAVHDYNQTKLFLKYI